MKYEQDKGHIAQYNFNIADVFHEAWELTKDCKLAYWGATILAYLLFITTALFISWLQTYLGLQKSNGDVNIPAQIFLSLIFFGVTSSLIGGLFIMSIQRVVKLPINALTPFRYMRFAVSLLINFILAIIMTIIGFILFIVPGIYLSVATTMSMPLIIDRGVTPIHALIISCKAVNQHWFKIAGIYALISLIIGLSTLPFGLGLIWSIPWAYNVMGILYREIFLKDIIEPKAIPTLEPTPPREEITHEPTKLNDDVHSDLSDEDFTKPRIPNKPQ